MSATLTLSVPDVFLRDALGPQPPGVEVLIWDMKGPAPAPEIDMVVVPYMVGTGVLAQLATVKTRLVQSLLNGYDGVAQVLPPGHRYANAKSVHETSTAELTLALILALQRGIPDYVRASLEGTWRRDWHESLADRRVLLIGYGGVGRAIEERLLAFETNVIRLASHARTDERGEIFAMDSLFDHLGEADIVVVIVPLDESTTHLVNDDFLSAMHDGAMLVNVARGQVADTAALLKHASSGRLRLALDVTDPEPLPDGHPLFALPNVLISPHVGGASSAALPRMARLVNRQIGLLLEGATPDNVVLQS